MYNKYNPTAFSRAAAAGANQKAGDYWLDILSGQIPESIFPMDDPERIQSTDAIAQINFKLTELEVQLLMKISRGSDYAMHLILTALLVVQLHRSQYNGQYNESEDILVGTPIYKQPPEKEDRLLNTQLPLRIRLKEDQDFKQLLLQIREIQQESLKNQDFPFERLIELLKKKNGETVERFYDTAIILTNIQKKKYIVPKKGEKPLNILYEFTRTENGIEGVVEYHAGMYRETTVKRLIETFRRLLTNLLSRPDEKISQVDILSETEKKQLQEEFNRTVTSYPKDKTITRLFREQVERTPDRVALIGNRLGETAEEGRVDTLTYRELNRQSDRLARQLNEDGISTGDIVAVSMENCVQMIIGLWGILKAGAAFLPIDPKNPAERIQYMLKDSGAVKYITTEEFNAKDVNAGDVKEIRTKKTTSTPLPPDALPQTENSSQLCYVIYTSGTTGRPRGVMVEHRALVNLCTWHIGEFGITPQDRATKYASPGFDATVWEIFPYHTAGASLFIVADEIKPDVGALNRCIERMGVTATFMPTPVCEQYMKHRDLTLRLMVTGGDRLQRFQKQNYTLVNNYGPTENTVVSTSYRLKPEDETGIIPIGKPIANNRVYIVDRNNRLQPVGVPGELFVSGDGLARGYLNNPELTAEKFINPHSSTVIKNKNQSEVSSDTHWAISNDTVYRTGDKARWLPDGNIEFLGRIDQQVKIRGNRIELGEIESRLKQHDDINAVVVAVKKDKQGENYLCAYIEEGAESRQSPTTAQLREYLAQTLPNYMIPAYFQYIARIPITSNGKVDRKSLPEPENITEVKYIPPGNEVEKKLVRHFAAILEQPESGIGIDDNFFHRGGHSLKATLLTGKIQQEFDVEYPLNKVFSNPTVREMAQFITSAVKTVHIEIQPVEKKEYYPQSSAQKRLFLLNRFENVGIAYNIPHVMTLTGKPDIQEYERTFKRLIARHESLRTAFFFHGEEPVQRVYDVADVEFGIQRYRIEAGEDAKQKKTEIINQFIRPYQLDRAPLMRIGVIETHQHETILMFDIHHIVSDGTSMGILVDDFVRINNGEELPPQTVQYKDYVMWRESLEKEEKFTASREYWLGMYPDADEIPRLNIPEDNPRPPEYRYEGDRYGFSLSSGETIAYKQMSEIYRSEYPGDAAQGVTIFMNLLATLTAMYYRYTGQEDMVIGTFVAGRPHDALQGIIGMFINTLPIRLKPTGKMTYMEYLRQVVNTCIDAFDNQDVQFETLVEKLNPVRDPSRSPLFDICLMVQNFGTAKRSMVDVTMTSYEHNVSIAKFDITHQAHEIGDRLYLGMEYNTSLYHRDTIERQAKHLKNTLTYVTENPHTLLSEIEIIDHQEKQQLVAQLGEAGDVVVPPNTLHRQFEEQARRTPDTTALVAQCINTNRWESLTYRKLNQEADQLAKKLQTCGILPGDIVALETDRTAGTIIGILAILKTGAAYLPIDSSHPQERIDYILKDSAAKTIIKNNEIQNSDEKTKPAVSTTELPASDFPPTTLAYIIYTSGTTGRPRGVMVEHCNVSHLVMGLKERIYRHHQGRLKIAQLANYIFDASVQQYFGALLQGHTLHIVPEEDRADGERQLEYNRMHTIDIADGTPGHLRIQLEAQRTGTQPPPPLKHLIIGGEALPEGLAAAYLEQYKVHNRPQPRFTNVYGPTECTVDSTSSELRLDHLEGKDGIASIGTPMPDERVTIVFPQNHALHQPVGIPGELCIQGAGVARGYLNNPELTAEKFEQDGMDLRDLTDNNNSQRSGRCYKTGDLARFLPDGSIQYRGRLDEQVKIRGYRIELGEIERNLTDHRHIDAAVVAQKRDSNGENYLCAYIEKTGEEQQLLTASQLRDYLARTLPDYMIPTYYQYIDEIPLTSSGKIDRKSLPEPDKSTGVKFAAPRDELEKELMRHYARILNQPESNIGIDDNFFHLGGHSLKAAVLLTRIHRQLAVKVKLGDFFLNPEIRKLARIVRQSVKEIQAAIEPVEKKDGYPLSSAQKRLFFMDRQDAIDTSYNIPVSVILKGELDILRFREALDALQERHESLRTSFHMTDNGPVQVVHEPGEYRIPIEIIDRTAKTGKSENENTDLRDTLERIPSFELERPPLLMVMLIKQEQKKHGLIFNIHHIVGDGTSMGILIDDFCNCYNGDIQEPLRLQYKDYAHWQNERMTGGTVRRQEEYWLKQFSDHEEMQPLIQPLDYARPPVQQFRGAHFNFNLTVPEAAAAAKRAKENGVTLYMYYNTALKILLHRLSGQEDIVVGTGTMGRPHVDLEKIIGMFINTLAIRTRPGANGKAVEYLKQVKQTVLDAFDNQDLQFETLVEKLGITRDPSRNPLFDVLFVMQNFETANKSLRDITVEPMEMEVGTAKFDLTLYGNEIGETVVFMWEYATSLYKLDTIQRITEYYRRVIRQMSKEPEIRLADIQLLNEEEKQWLEQELNCTTTGYPSGKTLHGQFEEQVERTPHRIAITAGQRKITYRELNRQANRLAHYLKENRGIQTRDRIVLLQDRGIHQMIAIMGLLKAGAVVVPVDPGHPEERVKTILEDTEASAIVSQKRYLRTLNRLQWEVPDLHTFICLDTNDIRKEEEPEEGQLMNRKLWEYVGEKSEDEITAGGWNSSYTGKPLPKEQMDEFGDNVLKKLIPHLKPDRKVLEIGTAGGITMKRIAPKVGTYIGTDLSAVIIEKKRKWVKEQGYSNIRLEALPAHRIRELGENNFDIVIINSVIQCFKGHNYLRKVLRTVVKQMSENGIIFIGDIMDQEQKHLLIRDLKQYKRENRKKDETVKTDWSEELFISKRFWEDEAIEIPEISDIRCSGKIYTIENELTRYRYDVQLTIDKKNAELKRNQSAKRQERRYKYQHDCRALENYDHKKNQNPRTGTNSGNPAYIMYTSGTTGKPKGTPVTHTNVTRIVKNTNYIEITREDRLLQLSNYAFDGSVFDIYGTLLNGAVQVQIESDDILDIDRLAGKIIGERITVSLITTALFNALVEARPDSLKRVRKVLFGGEQASPLHVSNALEILGNHRLIHVYGPTETTVYATYYPVEKIQSRLGTVPIGGPVSNTTVYILDEHRNTVPVGVEGELYIGGPGTALGYLNRPELTREKFVDIRTTNIRYYSENQATPILYRTGDKGKRLENGDIVFTGRTDQQVKIRGFRIEPGEVENRLLAHGEVNEAVVIVRQETTGEKYLCAYVTLKQRPHGQTMNIEELREELEQELPAYMVPPYIIPLDRMPLTANGKVHRAKLPEPGMAINNDTYVKPRNRTEEKLQAIMADVLGKENETTQTPLGIDDNFFHRGGHSLKATLLIGRIRKEFDVEYPLSLVFAKPTIREMAGYITAAEKTKYSDIQPVEKREYYPQSSAQKRLFLLDRFENVGIAYNMPQVMILQGNLEIEKYEETFRRLIARHESLRTAFLFHEEAPVQRVYDVEDVEFSIQRYRIETGENANRRKAEIIDRFIRPYRLEQPPLMRIGVVEAPHRETLLMFDMHHIVSDGTSMTILVDDFIRLNSGEELPEQTIQYKDYVMWQESREKSGKQTAGEEYWLGRYPDPHDIPRLNIPEDIPRPSEYRYEGDRCGFTLSPEDTAAYKRIHEIYRTENPRDAGQGVTLFMNLLATLTAMYYRYTGQEDQIIGTGVAGRPHDALQRIIGMFINTLPIRLNPTGKMTYMEYLAQVVNTSIEAFEHQDLQFESLVEKLNPDRDPSRNPLFDICLMVHNFEIGKQHMEDVTMTPYRHSVSIAKFDITHHAYEIGGEKGKEKGDGLYLEMNYNTSIYRRETILRQAGHLLNTIRYVSRNPQAPLAEIEIIAPEEKRQIMTRLNEIEDIPIPPVTIHRQFQEQARRTPDAVALVTPGKKTNRWETRTYRVLNQEADQRAKQLQENGIRRGDIVALETDRTAGTIIAILGILKNGAAYLPIDPTYPGERIDYILKDSNAKIAIEKKSEARNPELKNYLETNLETSLETSLDDGNSTDQNRRGLPGTKIESDSPPDALAYIIYTSGTTGRPRGVMVEHRNVGNLVLGLKERVYRHHKGQLKVAQLANYVFDASVQQYYGALLQGHALHIVPKEDRGDGERQLDYYRRHAIDITDGTPGHLRIQLEAQRTGTQPPPPLKHLLIGGEALPMGLVSAYLEQYRRHQRPRPRFTNVYGPTECTVDSSSADVRPDELGRTDGIVTIGLPMPNERVTIVFPHNHEVHQPVGIPGELCIHGAGVARGYLNNPELTAEKFIEPQTMSSGSSVSPGGGMYKTGDLARFLPDGNIQYLGRLDRQVKVRGYRIELGEIENRLLEISAIGKALVRAVAENTGGMKIVAYVEPAQKGDPPSNQTITNTIKEHLTRTLPDYMHPAQILQLEKIPLTPSGKINERALPEAAPQTENTTHPPRDEVETRLAEIWSEVLGITQPIGIDDNYFQLGGHSLNATIMSQRVHKRMEVKIPLEKIFRTPTIRQLAQRIKETRPQRLEMIPRAPLLECYPLSPAQKRLYILQRMDENQVGYNMPLVVQLIGELDRQKLEKAFKTLIDRHESLRTGFHQENGEPVQKIHHRVPFEIKEEKRTGKSTGNRGEPIETLISRFVRPFDLTRPPLMRAEIISRGENRHILMVDHHHIITDGVSNGIMINELGALYSGAQLAEVPLQYKDYAVWQNRKIENGDIAKQEKYWHEIYAGEPPQPLEIPLDKPRPPMRSYEGNHIETEIDAASSALLNQMAHRNRATLYMVLQAAFNIMLAKMTGRDDIVVGTPIAGRRHENLQQTVGMFVNTLALRNRPQPDRTFVQFLADLREHALQAYENQDYPFEELVETVVRQRDTTRNPLVDIVFAHQNQAPNTVKIKEFSKDGKTPPLTIEPYPYEIRTAKFDLSFHVQEPNTVTGNTPIPLMVEYSTAIYEEETIRRIIGYYRTIVNNVIRNPEREIGKIEMIPPGERRTLLESLDSTGTGYPEEKTVQRLFREQVEKNPDRIAIVMESEADGKHPLKANENRHITYRELNREAHRLSAELRQKGVGTDTIVALEIEPSIRQIIAILGIVNAGAAYMPIDPGTPNERFRMMMKDSNAGWIVRKRNGKSVNRPPMETENGETVETIELDNRLYNRSYNRINDELNENVNVNVKLNETLMEIPSDEDRCPDHLQYGAPEDLLYIIYTSGSTGKPKGAGISNRNVVRLFFTENPIFDFSPDDVWTQFHSVNFDFSVWEQYGALLFGGKLVQMPRTAAADTAQYRRILVRRGVTVLNQTPSAFYALQDIEAGNPPGRLNLRMIVYGGEALNPARLKPFQQRYPDVRHINMYGITETTVHVTFKEITTTDMESETSNIGKPIPTLSMCILDPNRRLVPPGVSGEIAVGGEGLARGYLNRPTLTADKFIQHPYQPGQFLYLSGDRGKLLPNGDVEHCGRIDHQVKIRGYRIELGEIEKRIREHHSVKDVVVTQVKTGSTDSDKALCAYIVPQPDRQWESDAAIDRLKRYQARHLPAYMIPTHYVKMERFPVTPNGKVDRKKLPDPLQQENLQYIPPVGELEKQLASIWIEILGRDRIGVEDNYFDRGGNSLQIVKLAARINERLGFDVPVIKLFENPTIRSQAAYLRGEDGENNGAPEAAGKKEPLTRTVEIAVIGMAGRFPGAKNIGQFWDNLANGIESITFYTDQQLRDAGVPEETIADPAYVKSGGGRLEGKEYFDAGFFDYTHPQAESMSPQARVFHEVVWEALEHAGYRPDAGEQTIGIYAGASSSFYWEAVSQLTGQAARQGDFATGLLASKDHVVTNVAYKLNLKGPAQMIQTACSTSLVAIDQAVRSIRDGQCRMAVAGGVTVDISSVTGYRYQEGMVKSSDGHNRAFDAAADGLAGGEGAGAVVLKHIDDARNDGDTLHAIIKGIAVNNDGNRKVGYTAPSIKGQAEVIRAAVDMAKISPESITYVETHGTATPLGDPVEIQGLITAFQTDKKGFCSIGSVKTNIGHLDAAAGIAGFIKAVLSLKHRHIPPSLHYKTPNPKIDFQDSPFRVNSRYTPWESDRGPLRAGVSSFGIGGTNAHVILEEAPETCGTESTEKRQPTKPQLLVISAHTETALTKTAENLVRHLEANPALPLADVAYTLQRGRKEQKYRRCHVCVDTADALRKFSATVNRIPKNDAGKEPPVIFMFTGLGAQYVNMGRDLYRSNPEFRRQMDRSFEILKSLTGKDYKETLYPLTETVELREPEDVQPIVYVFEVALARTLMKYRITPDAMIGYSFGEYAAATVAGVMTEEDGIRLVYRRSRLIQAQPPGAMLSIPQTAAQIRQQLEKTEFRQLSLAVDNGQTVIVSGTETAIIAMEQAQKQQRRMTQRVPAVRAIHSAMMEPILEEFEKTAAGITLREPVIPYVSNVTGRTVTPQDARNPQYWVRHLRETVRFDEGIRGLLAKYENAQLIEIGPGREISTIVTRYMDKNEARNRQISLIRHPQEEISDNLYFRQRIGQLWQRGLSIDWETLNEGEKRQRVPLPTTPFEGKRYWNQVEALQKGGLNVAIPNTATGQPVVGGLQPKSQRPRRDWFYVPVWEQAPLTIYSWKQPDFKEGGSVLIFQDDAGLGERLKQRYRDEQTEETVITVQQGNEYEHPEPDLYKIDPSQSEHYELLFRDLKQTGRIPSRIHHLWGITRSQETGKTSLERYQRAQQTGLFSLIDVVKATGKENIVQPMVLHGITDGMQDVLGCEAGRPEKATLLGALKSIPQEYPNIRTRSIDIQNTGPGTEEQLYCEMLQQRASQQEDSGNIDPYDVEEIAFRGAYRWKKTFKSYPHEEVQGLNPRLKERGVYLITGGFGGMGFTIARHLAKNYRARLILVSRSTLPPRDQWHQLREKQAHDDEILRRIKTILEMEAAGAEVLVVSADVSDRKRMKQALEDVQNRFGAVNGVIHTAAVIDYGGIIQRRTPGQTETVLAPKAGGLQVLEECLDTGGMDFFMIFSSIASVLTPFGQVGYAAANAYLDAYAYSKNRRNGKYQVINWSDWLEVGMAVKAITKANSGDHERIRTELENMEPIALTPVEGVDAFNRILAHRQTRVVVSIQEMTVMNRIHSRFNIDRPGRKSEKKKQHSRRHPRPDLTTEYRAPTNKQERDMAEILQEYLALQQVGIDDNYFELGLSSLDVIQVNTRLKEKFKQDIPLVTMFSYPTIRHFSNNLKEIKVLKSAVQEEQNETEPQSPDLLYQSINLLKK
jgi:amino acid adenylation domain-containing protein